MAGDGQSGLLCGSHRGEPVGPSDDDDLEQAVECSEVVTVAGVEGELRGQCRRGDGQIDGSSPAGLASRCHDRGEDPAVGPRSVGIEREWVEGGLGALQAVLSTAALVTRALRHAE